MRRTASILLAGALALGAVATTEAEDLSGHPCYDEATEQLVYPEQQVWFHEGDNVVVLGAGVGKVGNDSVAPWDTTEPTTSVTGGAGAGAVTPGVATLGADTPAEQHAVFSGTFEGCLDTILLDIYSFDPSNRTGTGGVTDAPDCLPDCVPDAQPANANVGLVVSIDGNDVYETSAVGDETLTELSNEGFGPNRNQIAVNVGELMELYAGFDETLDLAGTHEITIQVRSWYVNTGHSVFVWDTSEVPSGLTFNGTIPDGVPSVG